MTSTVFIDGPDGNRIACHVSGRPTGPTAILTSGIGCGPVFVRDIARELSRDHRVVYWDYRGHGASSPAPRGTGYRIHDHARDLAAVVDAFAGDEPPIMISFSMGVQVHVEWTRRRPGRAAAHVMMLGVPRNPLHRTVLFRKRLGHAAERAARAWSPVLRLAQPAVKTALRTPLTYAIARACGGLRPSCPPREFGEFVRYATEVPLDAYLQCAAGLMKHDGTDAFLEIDEPVLMLAAEHDLLIHRDDCRAFAERLPHAQFRTIRATGHASALEDAPAITASIRRFVDQSRREPGPAAAAA
jgi:pimeloyl-ACP methyl ester carboxylesterase